MNSEPTVLQGLLLRLLPAHRRDDSWGDLLESAPRSPPTLWLHRQLAGLALHWQSEPWRDRATAARGLLLLVAAGGLLWLLPMVSQALLAQAAVFDGQLIAATLALWRAESSVAGAAAGLLLGRATVLPEHGSALRGQGALGLALALGLHAGLIPAMWLLGAAWLGHRHRQLA